MTFWCRIVSTVKADDRLGADVIAAALDGWEPTQGLIDDLWAIADRMDDRDTEANAA